MCESIFIIDHEIMIPRAKRGTVRHKEEKNDLEYTSK